MKEYSAYSSSALQGPRTLKTSGETDELEEDIETSGSFAKCQSVIWFL